MKFKIITAAFSFYLIGLSISAQENFNTRKLDSLLNLYYANNKMIASVAVSKNGNTLYQKALGYKKLNQKDSLISDINTKYRIGSISKMFTATMIFQLIEEKKLSLTTQLSDFFPQLPNAKKITIETMLNHHSGLHNFTDDSTYLNWNTKKQNQQQMLELISKQKPDFEPNEKGEYSNTNYALLGYVVEKITKKKYSKALKERILSKTNLKQTYYGGKTNVKKNECYSYSIENKKWKQESETDMSIPGGAGAILSTPTELTKFITALFNKKLISEESLELMKQQDDGYGKGMFRYPAFEHVSYGHTGGIDGFSSMLVYIPDDSLSIAFCGNGLNCEMNDIMIGILRICYDLKFPFPDFTSFEVPENILKQYEGLYTTDQIALEITIKKDGDRLTAQATGQRSFPLEAMSETEFKFDGAGIRITFGKDSNNKTTLTLKQGGMEFLFEKE